MVSLYKVDFCDAGDKSHSCVAGKKGHKGGGKKFSNPEEIDRQMRAQRALVSVCGLCPTRCAV